MSMLTDLSTVIAARLDGLSIFSSVSPALSGAKRVRPSAEIWLAEDLHVTDKPAVIRQLTWVVRIESGHHATDGALQQQIEAHIDAVRNTFSGWRPDDCKGIQQSFAVPLIKIESYQDHGNAAYLISLVVRVFPETFARIT